MTAETPFHGALASLLASPASEGVRSLEVRWIFPGRLEAAVAGWFGRFPATLESREDTYLLDPRWRGLSVKFRGGGPLEVKAYRGSPGVLDVAARARGQLEYWRKWSFTDRRLSRDRVQPPGTAAVRKQRRLSWFSLGSRPVVVRGPPPGQVPVCQVELTGLSTPGGDWWSLGFEATGPAALLRGGLEATAALVFAETMPAGVKLGPDESRSYAEWLRAEPAATCGTRT